jgi:3-phosphoglycerate kinase
MAPSQSTESPNAHPAHERPRPAGKRVLIREDLNVPVKDGKVTSEQRILRGAADAALALEKGAAVMVTSHLGRRRKAVDGEDSLAPVAARCRNCSAARCRCARLDRRRRGAPASWCCWKTAA